MQAKLHDSWMPHLEGEFRAPYMRHLRAFLAEQLASKKILYPHGRDIFNALNLTPLNRVKVVIIGQDPYHGPGQAHGLCFSVRPGVPAPPSLVNIFKEIERDLGHRPPGHGHLDAWAHQGVLLLNSVLTVERGRAASHRGKGWESFTDKVVDILNEHCEGLVFLLWGSHAKQKAKGVDRQRHLVLTGPHPSPLSAHRGFFGCGHFSQANTWLREQGKKAIHWELPPLP